MEVIANGLIPGTFPGIVPAYNLIKTDMKGNDASEAKFLLFNYLNANFIGDGATATGGQNSAYISSIPSIWGEVGLSVTSQLAQIFRVGLAIGVSNFSGNSGILSFSDGGAVNANTNVNSPVDGALFLRVLSGLGTYSGSYKISNYDIGIFIEATFDTSVLNIFFTNTNEIYFFHTNATFNAPFGTIGRGLRYVHISAYCEAFQIYCIRAKISIAQGEIENAAGGVAPNCKVYMFRRNDGKLLGSTVSDQNGHYEMLTSAISGDTVFMVCLDDDNAPDFEGIIYDRITV